MDWFLYDNGLRHELKILEQFSWSRSNYFVAEPEFEGYQNDFR